MEGVNSLVGALFTECWLGCCSWVLKSESFGSAWEEDGGLGGFEDLGLL